MKLLYLYMDEVGPLGASDFNFDSDWHFAYVGREGEGIKVLYKQRLPKNFFGDKGVVDSISVVVGVNGAGKTSLAASIAQVLRQDHILKAYGYRGRYKRYCAVVKEDDSLKIYTNFHVKFDEDSVGYLPDFARSAILNHNKRIDDCAAFESMGDGVRFFYYSPIVTTERVVFGSTKVDLRNVVVDLSSTALLTDCGSWREYQMNERKTVLRFLHAANVRQVDVRAKEQFGMSLPKNLYVCVDRFENENIGLLLLPSEIGTADKYQHCRDLLESRDNIAESLVAFVARAIPVRDMLPDLNVSDDDRVERNYHAWGRAILDAVMAMYGELGWSFNGVACHEDRSKEQRIRAYEVFCGAIRKIAADMQRAEFDDRQELEFLSFVSEVSDDWDVGDVYKGLEFYDSLLALAKRKDADVDERGVQVPFGLKGAVDEAALLIEKASTFQLVGEWKADFETAISSGEMAYCSLFSRLYERLPTSGNILLFMDEAETTLHPDRQAQLVERIVRFFEAFFPKLHAHIVFATHSPILLSDIPDGNVVFFEKTNDGVSRVMDVGGTSQRSFAANIFDLYRDSFFMYGGTVGGFARSKLDAIMEKIRDIVQGKKSVMLSQEEWQVTELVGDPQARRYFESVRSLVEYAQRKNLP